MTREFEDILHPLRKNTKVKSMKLFRQHGKTSTYKHCNDVAKTCYWINERFHLHSNKRTLLISAMLYDSYLHCIYHVREEWIESGTGEKYEAGYRPGIDALGKCLDYSEFQMIKEQFSKIASMNGVSIEEISYEPEFWRSTNRGNSTAYSEPET